MLHSVEIVSAALFALVGATLITRGFPGGAPVALPGPPQPPARRAVFLFEGGHLVDASPAARRLLPRSGGGEPDLAAVLALLSRSFGADLAPRIAALPPGGRLVIPATGGADVLEASDDRGALRITLRLEGEGAALVERLSLESACEELALLRGIAEDAPQPIWALGPGGAVVWANRAYLALADLARGAASSDPDSGQPWPTTPVIAGPTDPAPSRRVALPLPGREAPMWLDVTTVQRGALSLSFATDVGDLVQAESARVHFVQALAKTFAHLSTGLAIFDRQRRLVLFNPAFGDLTGLPIAFLSARPLVHTVLDRLREAKILPEPRDYASWREEVAALEAAAARGAYADTWTLPGGRTFRVTGRPHPDGALAFLFEDISDEVGQTRRLRTELDAARAVLDADATPVAVFGPDGSLLLSNAAYDDLWGAPDDRDAPRALSTEIARWEAGCAPSALWTDLRSHWPSPRGDAVLRRPDGSRWHLRTTPLARGATLVRFHEAERPSGADEIESQPAFPQPLRPEAPARLPAAEPALTP